MENDSSFSKDVAEDEVKPEMNSADGFPQNLNGDEDTMSETSNEENMSDDTSPAEDMDDMELDSEDWASDSSDDVHREATPSEVDQEDFIDIRGPDRPMYESFENVVGLENEKKTLMCTAGLWLQKPELFDKVQDAFYKAGRVLLFGPPGCQHRALARAFAGAIPGCKLIEIDVDNFIPGYVDKDLLAKTVLEEAMAHKSVLLINFTEANIGYPKGSDKYWEIHRRVSALLQSIQKNHCRCAVIIDVGYYQELDNSIKDEFTTHIYVQLPNHEARKSLIQNEINKPYSDLRIECTKEELEELSELSKGWSYKSISSTLSKLGMIGFREIHRASHLIVSPPNPCEGCVPNLKPKDYNTSSKASPRVNRAMMRLNGFCPHQKVHPSHPNDPGAFKVRPNFDASIYHSHLYIPPVTMEMAREAFKSDPEPVTPGDLEYCNDYATSHGHYTAYRGKTKELDFQPPYTNEPLKSLNSVYSLKQMARMEVFKAIDDDDFEVLWERVSQLEIPTTLRLYIMNENI